MTRSSRHKSSKHSSKEAREYSDSEKGSSVKDRKSRDETSVRGSHSGEKRKVEAKESKETLNGDYVEECNWTSKRRKERVEDSVNDRWNGGEEDAGRRGKDTRSKKRDGNIGYGETEDSGKKSGGKHRESSGPKETLDAVEREKKWKDGDGHGASKQPSDKTDSNAPNSLQTPDSDNQHDQRIRRNRDSSRDGDRHHDNVDVIGRQLASKEDTAKDVRSKDDKHKDERFRDKYHEDLDRENRHREDKQRDERARDRVNNRSDEKLTRDEKDTVEIRQKKSIAQDEDREHDRDYDFGRDGNWDREYYHRDRDRERDRERDRDRDHLHDRDWELDRERDKEREHEWDRDRDRNNDYDRAYLDDRSARYKDCKGKKRSPDDFDDYDDVKRKGSRNSVDNEKKSSSKNEQDADRGRSQMRQSHVDNISNSRRRLSPNSSSHGASDDNRSSKAEDSKYKDSPADQRPKTTSIREVTTFSSDRVSKYRSSEKPIKMDEGNMGELSVERSSSMKASPKGLADRSPSSSLERRYMNRNSVRRGLEVEESGRRTRDSMGARDLPSAEDRSIREMLSDESLPSDNSFYNRSSQSNSALIPPSSFRGGVGSPSFAGSVEEDGRSGGRFKRSGDPMSGRGQGNAWRGAQNWSSPVPNGFIPFQHGPSHGGFQTMMPQFPSPPLFGARPPMDINQSGIPYHIPDADRFSAHLRPLGWQNMMDGSGPVHMHAWDGNNGVFRDEAHFYGGTEWDQNRHPMNGRGWESGADLWKGQNGDLPSTPLMEDATVHGRSDDVAVEQTHQKSQKDNNNNNIGVPGKDIDTKHAITSTKESSKINSKTPNEKMVDPSMSSDDDIINVSSAYLSKLDISEKLAGPELFKQGIGLLNKGEKTAVHEDTAMLVNLKDGARVVAKSSSLWFSSLVPATNNSVFQRALNIYKRQSLCVHGGIVDVLLASNLKDEVPADDVGKMESPLRCCNLETADAVLPDIDEKAEAAPEIDEKSGAAPDMDGTAEVVPLTAPHEKPGEIVLPPSVGADANVDTPHELPDEASSHNRPIPVQDDSQEKVDGVFLETPSIENFEDDSIANAENAAQTASVLPTVEQNTDDGGEMKGDDFSVCSGGRGDGLSGALNSPKGSGSMMMWGSNESESVILSRIHHSPENTH